MNHRINDILNSLFIESARALIFDWDPTTGAAELIVNAPGEPPRRSVLEHLLEQDFRQVLRIHDEDAALVRSELLAAVKAPARSTITFRSGYTQRDFRWYRMQYASVRETEDGDCRVVGLVTNVQSEMERRTVVESFAARMNGVRGLAGQDLTVSQQVFEILYSTPDFHCAIDAILGALGEAFGADRVYIFEDTGDHRHCCNTFEWCAPGVPPEMDKLSRLSYDEDLGGRYLENFNAEGVFHCPDVTRLPKEQYDILAPQGIQSMLQCAIAENGEFKGYIGFDDCRQKREWSREQLRTLHLTARVVGTFLCKKRREEALNQSKEQLEIILNCIPGGVGIYGIEEQSIRQLYLNDGYYKLLGDTRENRRQYAGTHFCEAIHPEDSPEVERRIAALLRGADHVDVTYRCVNYKKDYVWLRLIGDVHTDETGGRFIYCVHTNVDEQMKKQLELKTYQMLADAAMQEAKMSAWEFYPDKRCAILTEAAQKQHGLGRVVEQLPESMVDSGFVHPDSAADYRELFSGRFPDGQPISREVYVQTADRSGYWWERYMLVPVYDQSGALVKAIGTSVDVTEQRRIEEKYQKRLRDLEGANDVNLIAKGGYNLSNAALEYYEQKTADAVDSRNVRAYESGLHNTALRIIDLAKRREFEELFDRQTLIRQYQQGKTDFSIEYQRKSADGSILWAKTQCNTFSNPKNGNIMCFIYSHDITEQKIAQEMIDSVVRLDYDYLALLDCRSCDYLIYASREKDGSPLPPFHTSNYETEVAAYAREHLVPEDVERNIHDMSIANIRSQLRDKDYFVSYANVRERDGRVSRKKLQYSYLDRIYEKVLITRVDITDLYRKEQRQINELRQAMAIAEQANRSKSEFLSRMSHDLRTPMNALIGLTSLAREDVADATAMEEYLEKINSSAGFLLGLVNDCLDMEKISSGKMRLNPVPYAYSDFANSVKTMMTPLCRQKKITLLLDEPAVCPPIMVDRVRFEQVFFNLLSNAVKFTPAGGTVELEYQNAVNKNGMFSCDFVVRDNGIGMSEAFQQRMFDPFEQESSEVLPQLQGTGLGLSIVKSIVDLMGGVIAVRSRQGEGTEITVHLEIPVVRGDSSALPVSVTENVDEVLRGKRVLLVEDHPLNTEIARKLLGKKAVETVCACNGKEGLETFASSPIGYFDAVLMDIRMPVMGGLESAERIRSLPRPDAAVPIIAMSANAFEEDAKKSLGVGMNAHLAKPVSPEKLYETLAKYWLERR